MSHLGIRPGPAALLWARLPNVGGSFGQQWRQNRREGLWCLLLQWQDRVSQRHRLAQLEETELGDMGLTFADAEVECAKPFWAG